MVIGSSVSRLLSSCVAVMRADVTAATSTCGRVVMFAQLSDWGAAVRDAGGKAGSSRRSNPKPASKHALSSALTGR